MLTAYDKALMAAIANNTLDINIPETWLLTSDESDSKEIFRPFVPLLTQNSIRPII